MKKVYKDSGLGEDTFWDPGRGKFSSAAYSKGDKVRFRAVDRGTSKPYDKDSGEWYIGRVIKRYSNGFYEIADSAPRPDFKGHTRWLSLSEYMEGTD